MYGVLPVRLATSPLYKMDKEWDDSSVDWNDSLNAWDGSPQLLLVMTGVESMENVESISL